MRISGTGPSSVILSETKKFKTLNSDAQKVPKQAEEYLIYVDWLSYYHHASTMCLLILLRRHPLLIRNFQHRLILWLQHDEKRVRE